MNWKKLLNWLKSNIGLTIGAIISIAALAWIGYSVWVAYDTASVAATEREQTDSALKRMRSRKPFPHVENIGVLSNTVATLSGTDPNLSVSNWLDQLSATRVPVSPVKPEAFVPLLLRRSSALVAEARKQNVGLPEKFGFGFGRYLNAGTPPASDTNEISGLLTQWNTIETLTRLLVSNRVSRIDGIRRARWGSEVPRESRDTSATAAAALAATASDEHVAALVKDQPGEITRMWPFELDFTCKKNEDMRNILNEIGKTREFFVVRSVGVVSSRLTDIEAGGRAERERVAAESAAAGMAVAPVEMPVPTPGPAMAGPPGRPGAGVKIDKVFGMENVLVKLRVDLVEFRKPTEFQKPVAAAGKPRKK